MSYTSILVHVVWGTKNREPILTAEKRDALFAHIRQNARSKGIYIDTIGGYTDHVHCLISLGAEQNIARVVQLIKGESAFWSNKVGLIKPRLMWASYYFAGSVGYLSAGKVRDYVNRQVEHHSVIPFAKEYDELLLAFGIDGQKPGCNHASGDG